VAASRHRERDGRAARAIASAVAPSVSVRATRGSRSFQTTPSIMK
jgi:hypothetical protein